jgi:putative cardiolipin synthase
MASMQALFRRGLALSGLVLLTLLPACAALFGGMPQIPPSLKMPSTALEANPDTQLGRAVTPLKEVHPGRSSFYLLHNGIEALAARLLLSHRAERSIDVQYYLLHADLRARGCGATPQSGRSRGAGAPAAR